ncbi:MAG: S9 family peptidase [Candidatus Zixiibacteriota bacterium]|nr:MAG: S9 family peptidase [candidate division Zixibacteria bacterium]
MPITDGIIRTRELITLKKNAATVVGRFYSPDLIEKTIVEKISYLSDGLTVRGCLARPEDEGVYPVLIWNRGGSGDRGALSDLTAYLMLASTAIWGYVVLATHYRGNKGGEGIEDWGGEDLTDALNMIEVAKNLPECDTGRIAIEGASRGGMIAYRALVKYRKFNCAIVHAGIADVARLAETRSDFKRFVDKTFARMDEKERLEKLRELSAVHFADQLPKDCPILIMHGDADTIVPVEQSYILAEKLRLYNVSHKLAVLKGGSHIALKDGTYREIDHLRKKWLEKYLKKV